MTISLRLDDNEVTLFKKYAELKGMSVSELFRQSVNERIEDEYDLQTFEKAIAEYRKNPTTYSHEEVKTMLELN